MKNISILGKSLRSMALLMLAGATAGLVLADAVNKVQSSAGELRTACDPYMHFNMMGPWPGMDALPNGAQMSAKVAAALQID